MFNLQGKNVVIFGGLNGLGLSLTKNILNKKVNRLYIIDVNENLNLIQELRSQYQGIKIDFERIDLLQLNAGQIQKTLHNVLTKLQNIDVLFNSLELIVEKDLQRTIDINLNLYMNLTILARNVMDRSKGGRGGLIINVLNNLGLQTINNAIDVQQFLITKQLLLSLNKTLSDDFFFQHTGVAVFSVLPVFNQKALFKHMEKIKEIGLQQLVVDINSLHQQDNRHDHHDHHEHNKDLKYLNRRQLTDLDQDLTLGHRLGDDKHLNLYNSNDIKQWIGFNQDIQQRGDIRKVLDLLTLNIIRSTERHQNGQIYVVGLDGIKNIQQTENWFHL